MATQLDEFRDERGAIYGVRECDVVRRICCQLDEAVEAERVAREALEQAAAAAQAAEALANAQEKRIEIEDALGKALAEVRAALQESKAANKARRMSGGDFYGRPVGVGWRMKRRADVNFGEVK